MDKFSKILNYTGWSVFGLVSIVYVLTAESTVSLWDCGEFIACVHRLQIMHPPGAPLYMLIGRLFTIMAETVSDDPSSIAYSLNLLSGLSTAVASMCTSWIAMRLGKRLITFNSKTHLFLRHVLLIVVGIVSALTVAFSTSVWFSAVEAEVYGLSTCFSMLILWSVIKWYDLPDEKQSDRWLVFSFLLLGMSLGVHLLGLLTLPSIALIYYLKKYKRPTVVGGAIAIFLGLGLLIFIQKGIIIGLPKLWSVFEILAVNNFNLPLHSGIFPMIFIVFAFTYLLLKLAKQRNLYTLHLFAVSMFLLVSAYSVYGTILIRSASEVSINSNEPNNVFNFIPYLNREQYGHKPLAIGPHYKAKPIKSEYIDRFDYVNGRYEVVDKVPINIYQKEDLLFFPRIGPASTSSKQRHEVWRKHLGYDLNQNPNASYNMEYFIKYQLGWMYWRYFMWNFAGKQNKEQGSFSWNPKSGNWSSGINFIDEARLHAMDFAPDSMENDTGRNTYYLLPFLLGLIGMIFHFKRDRKTFFFLLTYCILTGIGITVDSNLLPFQPRERHYVIVGSFIVFSIWIGYATLAFRDILQKKTSMQPFVVLGISCFLALLVPILMLFQNWDDNDRSSHSATRDYAYNLLSSVEQDAILFVYGDNDKFPLLYLQEVEKVRQDVQVVNLSVLDQATYINSLRSKINNAKPIQFQLGEKDYLGSNKNFVYLNNAPTRGEYFSIQQVLSDFGRQDLGLLNYGNIPTKNLLLELNTNSVSKLTRSQNSDVLNSLPIDLGGRDYLTKGDLAKLDIIQSNIDERPIYFSPTCPDSELLGLNRFISIEGLCLRIVPYEMGILIDFSPVAGSGKINIEKTYNLLMNEWKWGGFDKEGQHISYGYKPIVNAMQLIILRLATNLTELEDHKRAAAVCNKYFEVFPHANFPYDARIRALLTVLVRAGDYNSVKRHIDILTKHSIQTIDFYLSLYPSNQTFFSEELNNAMVSIQEAYRHSEMVQDPSFEQRIKSQLIPYLRVAK